MADASLEEKIVNKLREDDPNLYQAQEPGMKDPTIGRIANDREAVLITQDVKTFLIENYRENGKLPQAGFVQIRMDKMSDEAKAERLSTFLKEHGHGLAGKVATVEHRTERIRTTQEVMKDIDRNEALKHERERKVQSKEEGLHQEPQNDNPKREPKLESGYGQGSQSTEAKQAERDQAKPLYTYEYAISENEYLVITTDKPVTKEEIEALMNDPGVRAEADPLKPGETLPVEMLTAHTYTQEPIEPPKPPQQNPTQKQGL